METEHRKLDLLERELDGVLSELELVNQGPLQCRELSLAITKIEEALHWLNDIPDS